MLTYTGQINNKTVGKFYPIMFIIIAMCAVSNVFLIGIHILCVLCVVYFLLIGKITLHDKMIVLFSFAIFYTIFSLVSTEFSLEPFKTFVFLLLWMVVYALSKNKDIKQIFYLIFLLGLGMAVHGIVNFIYNIANGTNMISGKSYDFWSQTYSSATGQAINFTLLIAISFWAIFLQKRFLLKFIGAICFIVALVYDIQLGGRTFLILSLSSIFFGVFAYIIINGVINGNAKKTLLVCFSVALVLMLFFIAFNRNWFGLMTLYKNSYLYKRLDGAPSTSLSEDGRVEKKIYYLQHFFDNIFGGEKLQEAVGSSHELWLDVYDSAGIIPYILIILFTLQAVKTVLKIVKQRQIEVAYRVGLLVYIFVIILQFFVEPILSGAPMLFCSFIMIDAALTRYCDDKLT